MSRLHFHYDPAADLVTVDPGVRGCGVAWFREGRLWRAEYLEVFKPKASIPDDLAEIAAAVVDPVRRDYLYKRDHRFADPLVVVEAMHSYAGSRSASTPADLLRVQAVAFAVVGVAAALGYRVQSVEAGTWNGQLPREIRMQRTKEWAATHGGLERVVQGDHEPRLIHNAWSAVGIGRWVVDPAARHGR